MTSVATTMMTDEEKAELEKQMNGGGAPAVEKTEAGPADDATHTPATPVASRPSSPGRKAGASSPTSPGPSSASAPANGTSIATTSQVETASGASPPSPSDNPTSKKLWMGTHPSNPSKDVTTGRALLDLVLLLHIN